MNIDLAYLSALSALIGTITGGAISYFTTRYASTQQHAHETRIAEIDKRESVFSDFVGESMRLSVISITKEADPVEGVKNLFPLEARIQMLSSEVTAEAATDLRRHVISVCTNSDKQEKHIELLEETNKVRSKFIELARDEIEALKISYK